MTYFGDRGGSGQQYFGEEGDGGRRTVVTVVPRPGGDGVRVIRGYRLQIIVEDRFLPLPHLRQQRHRAWQERQSGIDHVPPGQIL